METQQIILTIVSSMLAMDLLVLFFIPNIRKQIKKGTDSNYDEFKQILEKQNQTLDAVTLFNSTISIRIREERQAMEDLSNRIDLVHSKINEFSILCNNFDRVSSDLSETIRKERIEFYQLKDLMARRTPSKLEKQYKILQTQYEIACKQRDELQAKKYPKKPIEVLTDDREENRLLREKIQAGLDKGKNILNIKLYPLHEDNVKKEKPTKAKEVKKVLETPIPTKEVKKSRKYSYHAYNTPERMKELRRLKALKKKNVKRGRPKKKTTEPSVIVKNKVGRPKGSKNKFKNL